MMKTKWRARIGIPVALALGAAMTLTSSATPAAGQGKGKKPPKDDSTCDLTQPTDDGFSLPITLNLDGAVEGARFGNLIAGRQVSLAEPLLGLADTTEPILFATTEADPYGTARLHVYALDPALTPNPVPVSIVNMGSSPNVLLVADFDGNAVPDFIAATGYNDYVEVFLGHAEIVPDPEDRNKEVTLLVYDPQLIVQLDCPTDVEGCLPQPQPVNGFGSSLAVANIDNDKMDEIAIGARGGGKGKNATIGAVFIYDNPLVTTPPPQLLQKLTASDECNSSLFGKSVAFGDVDGTPGLDLLAGDSSCKPGGAAFVFPGVAATPPIFGTPVVLTTGASGDGIGTGITTALPTFLPPGLNKHDAVVTTRFSIEDRRAEVFPGIGGPKILLRPPDGTPLEESQGWATTGVNAGDIDGDGFPDYLIGAPNADCGKIRGSVGTAFLFQSTSVTPFADPIVFRPTDLQDNWNAYGWSAVMLSGTVVNETTWFVLIGEPGRNRGGFRSVGRVYIYRRN